MGACSLLAVGERLRAPLRYLGGKGNMVKNILSLLPDGRVYVEPYCGGASVFFAKVPSPIEVLNDLDGDVINVFRVLQDKEKFDELKHRVMWTPYSLAEFKRALEMRGSGAGTDVERAWAELVVHGMAMNGGGYGVRAGSWARDFQTPQSRNKWLARQYMLDAWRWRLMQAYLDNRDALEVIQYWDGPETVFYLDPPYHPDTRGAGVRYKCDGGGEHLEQLVQVLLSVKGQVVLSGYDHKVYSPLVEAGWIKRTFRTSSFVVGRTRGSRFVGEGSVVREAPRTECVWVKGGDAGRLEGSSQ